MNVETELFSHTKYIKYVKYIKWVSTHTKYAHLVWIKTRLTNFIQDVRWWATNVIIHSLIF